MSRVEPSRRRPAAAPVRRVASSRVVGVDEVEPIQTTGPARRRARARAAASTASRPARRGRAAGRAAPGKARAPAARCVGATGSGCGWTGRARRPRARSARRLIVHAAGRGRAPSAGSARAAGSPSRRRTQRSGRVRCSSLATTVSTPAKWPGRLAPSRQAAERAGVDPDQRARRRDRPRQGSARRRRRRPRLRAQFEIGVERAGVAVRGPRRPELQGVHEDRHDHAARPARRAVRMRARGRRATHPSSSRRRAAGPPRQRGSEPVP